MSGIYITGMELPKDGEMLMLCVGYNGKVLYPIEFATEDFLFEETGETAIELSPHGRLVDADALMKKSYEIKSSVGRYSRVVHIMDVKNAETIIPASGGADNG